MLISLERKGTGADVPNSSFLLSSAASFLGGFLCQSLMHACVDMVGGTWFFMHFHEGEITFIVPYLAFFLNFFNEKNQKKPTSQAFRGVCRSSQESACRRRSDERPLARVSDTGNKISNEH